MACHARIWRFVREPAGESNGAGDGDRTRDIELGKRDNARALVSGRDLLRAPCVVVHVDKHIHREDRHDEARNGVLVHFGARVIAN